MHTETHAHILDLLPAYALGCLDADEAAEVATHLASCAACRQELLAYQAVADQLPLALPEASPPTALKQQLMQQIRHEAQRETAVSPPQQSWWQTWQAAVSRFFSKPQWQVAIAFALVLLLAGNILLWRQLRQTAVPGTQIALVATDAAPNATGFIYISADGEYGTLVVENLPDLPDTQQYQLWLTQDGTRSSGGLFSVWHDGYASMEIFTPDPLVNYQAFGITIEPSGGSDAPTGARVLFATR
ncbi:MAG: anti-sigma factor [Ardenticatenaceae bacterium]|nr:anti-sigma factor [Ardenticatenaceae bacterium]